MKIEIKHGEVEPLVCSVAAPHGVCAGELLREQLARLVALLAKQDKALPAWIGSGIYSEAERIDCLQREIENCLAHIQRLAVTPADRCIA